MIFIINIQTCMCDDEYTECNKAFECGSSSVTNLKYPFWGENRGKECGFSDPNMELTCERNVPKITINGVKYRILEWGDTTQKLTVARDDYWDGICTVSVSDKPNNSTFESAQFQRDGGVLSQVNLLYNCDTTMSGVYNPSCGGNIEVVYTFSDSRSFSLPCTPRIIVEIPVSVTQAAKIANLNDINQALQGGFDLKWTVEYGECQRCVGSGGVCGSNDGGTEFRCFCNDGAYRDTCGSQRAPTSSMSFTFYTINS